jgi:hypothetical protein
MREAMKEVLPPFAKITSTFAQVPKSLFSDVVGMTRV